MSDLNAFACTGRFTRDPETRFLAGDKCVCSFGLAVGRAYTANGEKREEVLFIDCEAWEKLAETIGKHCQKGKQVALSGRLKLDAWEDKDGKKQQKIRLIVQTMTFLASPRAHDEEAPRPNPAAGPARRPAGSPPPADDEPPF